jgi:hypothetical protein
MYDGKDVISKESESYCMRLRDGYRGMGAGDGHTGGKICWEKLMRLLEKGTNFQIVKIL